MDGWMNECMGMYVGRQTNRHRYIDRQRRGGHIDMVDIWIDGWRDGHTFWYGLSDIYCFLISCSIKVQVR